MEQFTQIPKPSPTSTALIHLPDQSAAYSYRGYNGSSRPYYDQGDDSPASSSLVEYWNVLRRHKWSILFSTVGGALLAILAAMMMTPLYEANTSLEVLNVNENFMNTKVTSPVTTNDISYDVSEEETQVQLLQGDALLDRVMFKMDPNYSSSKLKRIATLSWRNLLRLPDPAVLTDREKLLQKLALSLKVKATPRTRIIEVSARSKDPQLALEFINTLTNEFIEQNVEARRKTTQKVSDWLTGEIEEARFKLKHAEDALQSYAGTSGRIFTDEDNKQTNIATEKLQQLQRALSEATADRMTKQSNYELAQHSPPDALPEVLSDESLRDAMTQINTLRGQIADLSERFTPEYSKVKSAQAQLVALQASFERDRAAVIERVKNDYQEATRKEASSRCRLRRAN